MTDNEMTDVAHWESAWAVKPRMSFPTGIDVGTRNILDLLRGRLQPGMRFIEIGCAPGKSMVWASRITRRPVAGIDYSPSGVETSRWLAHGLGIQADIRCEDACDTSFTAASFDLVFSCGLIEHFEDPTPILNAHVRLVAPGGMAVIGIPNYQGMYRRVQAWCDPQNLSIHNLRIMNLATLRTLAPTAPGLAVTAFAWGRFSPWIMSLPTKLGRTGTVLSWVLNFAAQLQPLQVDALCPLLVLEIRRPCARPAAS